jgi:CBS-domain-containing membrane protein
MLCVSDIMTDEVYTLPALASVEEAAFELARRSITGAPVCDRSGRLLGVVGRAELADPERRGGDRVRDVMSDRLCCVRPDDPAAAAVALMVEQGVHHVLVVDEEGALAGIVTPMDVLRALARGERLEAPWPGGHGRVAGEGLGAGLHP